MKITIPAHTPIIILSNSENLPFDRGLGASGGLGTGGLAGAEGGRSGGDSGGVVGRLGGVRGGGADGGRGGGGGVQSPYFGFTFLHGESASKSES